jgi:hypothetical protein
MFGSRTRAVAVSVAVAGAVALAVTTATAANAVTITSGTGTLTVNQSYLLNLAKQGVIAVPTQAQSVTYSSSAQTVTVVYTATGGDADVSSFSGEVDYSGGLTFFNGETGKHVSLSALNFQLIFDSFGGTASDGSMPTVLDAAGHHVATVSGSTQTFAASDLEIDSAGATYLNGVLGTSAFHGGDQVGTFATSYTGS